MPAPPVITSRERNQSASLGKALFSGSGSSCTVCVAVGKGVGISVGVGVGCGVGVGMINSAIPLSIFNLNTPEVEAGSLAALTSNVPPRSIR